MQCNHVKAYKRLTEFAHGARQCMSACQMLVRSWSHRWLVQTGNDGKTSN